MKHIYRLIVIAVLALFFINAESGYAEQKPCNLEIIHTNDVHGKLVPFKLGISDYDQDAGGMARRYSLINKIKKQDSHNYNILLLDAGDIAQGSTFFNLYSGIPDIEFMNELKYDAATLGNHEFDKGSLVLADIVDKAEFPFLAANLKFSKDSPLQGKIKPYIIKNYNGCRVGIIGLVTDEVRLISNIGRYTRVLDPLKTLKKYIRMIDNDTDVIIVLSHCGLKYDKLLASNIENADIIVGGHSHTIVNEAALINDLNNHPVIIVQSGEFGRYLGDLKVKVENDEVSIISYKLLSVDSKIPADKKITMKLKTFQDQADKLSGVVVGKTNTSINFIRDEVRTKETSGGNFVVDAIKSKFKEAEIIFQNGGGIRSDKILHPGDITMSEVLDIHPFDDEIILFDLKGKDIKSALERSVASLPYSSGGFLQVAGITFVADVSKQPQKLSRDYLKVQYEGNRISDVYVDGKPLDDNKLYRVAANTFLVNGGNGFWSLKNESKNIYNTGIIVTDVLESYLKEKSPVSPVVEDRIKVINIPKIKDEY